MRFQNYLGIFGLTAVMACSAGGNSNEQSTDTTANVAVDTLASQSLAIADENQAKVFDVYIKLKDQLVATNFEGAKTASQELASTLGGQKDFENSTTIVQQIAEAKDIATQRKLFTDLSNNFIALYKNAKINAGTIYVQHCPMANDNNGGDWLSKEKKIQNPYYGDEMMECGAVIEKITTK